MRDLLRSIYNSKYFPRFFYIKPDGGAKSGVTAYFLVEWKVAFSIGILKFNPGSREAFHSHAFNGLTFWLKGHVTEVLYPSAATQDFKPSLRPKFTPKTNVHKVIAHKTTYALVFRGPWENVWHEIRGGRRVNLTHGRQEVK